MEENIRERGEWSQNGGPKDITEDHCKFVIYWNQKVKHDTLKKQKGWNRNNNYAMVKAKQLAILILILVYF